MEDQGWASDTIDEIDEGSKAVLDKKYRNVANVTPVAEWRHRGDKWVNADEAKIYGAEKWTSWYHTQDVKKARREQENAQGGSASSASGWKNYYKKQDDAAWKRDDKWW